MPRCRTNSITILSELKIIFQEKTSEISPAILSEKTPANLLNPHFANTLSPEQNNSHFADDIFDWILYKENIVILIQILLKFVPKGQI